MQFAWLLEPIQRTLEVFQLQGQQWRTVGTWEGNVKVRAVPFDAIERAFRDSPARCQLEVNAHTNLRVNSRAS